MSRLLLRHRDSRGNRELRAFPDEEAPGVVLRTYSRNHQGEITETGSLLIPGSLGAGVIEAFEIARPDIAAIDRKRRTPKESA